MAFKYHYYYFSSEGQSGLKQTETEFLKIIRKKEKHKKKTETTFQQKNNLMGRMRLAGISYEASTKQKPKWCPNSNKVQTKLHFSLTN